MNKKHDLKKEGEIMHKKRNELFNNKDIEEEEKQKFSFKKGHFELKEEDKGSLLSILKINNNDYDLKIIERGTFFPLNICGIEDYFILYYNLGDKSLIIVKFSKEKSCFEYYDIKSKSMIDNDSGFQFLNLLNNPQLFSQKYSSYILKKYNKKPDKNKSFNNKKNESEYEDEGIDDSNED